MYKEYLPSHKYKWLPMFYDIILELKPKKILDFGTGHGGVTIAMALALKQIHEETGQQGLIYSYDSYGKHMNGNIISRSKLNETQENINSCMGRNIDIKKYIKLYNSDVFNVIKRKQILTDVDLVYIDIGNDGEKLVKIYNKFKSIIVDGKTIVFEGGSIERDEVEWMRDKVTIQSVQNILNYKLINQGKYCFSIINNNNSEIKLNGI